MVKVIKTRTKLKVGLVTSDGFNLTIDAPKGVNFAKAVNQAHTLAGGSRLINEDAFLEHLKNKYEGEDFLQDIVNELAQFKG